MSTEPVILYRYDTSPFSHKIDNVLSLKTISHEKVDVSPMLPRPEITDYLGVSYRRIPILAIGNDVYCDTSLIVSALERRFPPSKGFGTIFPVSKNGGSADTGLIKAFSKFYADNVLFPPATGLIPWDRLPEAFIADRSKLRGSTIDMKAMKANIPNVQSLISSHLLLVEEQLSDSREWLFNTVSPSLADISVHFVFAWSRSFKGTDTLFDTKRVPFTLQWLDRLTKLIKKHRQSQNPPAKLKGEDAATKITSSIHESYDVVGFDTTEASRLGFAIGDTVQVAPEDTGRNYPTVGKLVALNREEITLEVQGSKGLIRCHFPRLGFFVKPVSSAKL
jgi:glutathione S-transferase